MEKAIRLLLIQSNMYQIKANGAAIRWSYGGQRESDKITAEQYYDLYQQHRTAAFDLVNLQKSLS